MTGESILMSATKASRLRTSERLATGCPLTDQAWSVNGQPVASLSEVRSRLALVADIKIDSPVILHPDETVPVGNVIDVYDATRLAGFTQIQFAIAE